MNKLNKREILYSLSIFISLFVIAALFYILYKTNKSNDPKVLDNSQANQGEILDSIDIVSNTKLPKEYFIDSFGNDIDITTDYFNNTFNFKSYKKRDYKDLSFIMSGSLRDLFVFNKSGEMVYRLKHNIDCGQIYKDFEIYKNSIFLVCSKEGVDYPNEFSISQIDLESGEIVNNWSKEDGLSNTQNISMLIWEDNL